MSNSPNTFREWFLNKLFMGQGPMEYARSLVTPFNILAAIILIGSLPVFYNRYIHGLSTVIHANSEYPWGLLLSWGIFAGEPLFACGFIVAAAYYIFGMKEFKPFVRLAVLGGMLGYIFAASYLLIDLGRPWRIYYPMLINYGPASVLFVVAWHVSLYCTVQLLEFSPAILEWLGSRRLHKWAVKVTVALIIGGVILSTVHQSALGAMYLATPGKLHPLWYSSMLPLLFFSSAIYAAMSFAIILSYFAVVYFKERCDKDFLDGVKKTTVILGKGAALALFVYIALKVLALAQDNRWGYLNTAYGYWYLFEVIGLTLIPMILFIIGVRSEKIGLLRFASFIAVVGILINRVNVNLIAFNWNLPGHFEGIIPPWTEIHMIAAMVTLHIIVFRWIMNRFPVTQELPQYRGSH